MLKFELRLLNFGFLHATWLWLIGRLIDGLTFRLTNGLGWVDSF